MQVEIGDHLWMNENLIPAVAVNFWCIGLEDFKIRCETCGHEVMVPRGKVEKNIKKILPNEP